MSEELYCYDESYYDDEDCPQADCRTCGGEGWVWSVAEVTGRYFWDDDGPGDCPNCGGSGLAKDCKYF